jgi:zinc transport system substrate-binding protein
MTAVRVARVFVLFLCAGLTVPLTAAPAWAEPPKVVASIAPVHSLVAAVMVGVDAPTLMVPPTASPHTFALKPSDAKNLQNADLVFWVGENLEGFLRKPLKTLSKKATVVELAESKGVALLDRREGGAWEEEEHAGEGRGHKDGRGPGKKDRHAHDHEEGKDMHIWLDPANARAMVTAIAKALGERDPANKEKYAANATATVARLDVLEKDLRAKLAPVATVPYLVFHDAYHYFEKRFGLNAVGSITVNPEQPPGAKRIAEFHAKARAFKVACVFAEPQFDPKVVKTIVEGTSVRTGVLDPDGGAGLTPGPELYFGLMNKLADSLVQCLAAR